MKYPIFSLFLILAITTIHASPVNQGKEGEVEAPAEVQPVETVDPEHKQEEKFFFPLISFSGSKPSVSAPPPPPSGPGGILVQPVGPPLPPSQVIVVPQNTTISVASPGQPITVYQSGPTVISSG